MRVVADEIVKAGGTVLSVVADVTRETDVQTFVDQTLDKWGQLDVMMCNAGYGCGTIDTVPGDRMRESWTSTTWHAFRRPCGAAGLPSPVTRHLIIISSIVGKRGIPFMGPYSATKFAQAGLAECLRGELVGTPIHCSVVYPISTQTEFFEVMTRHSGHATRASGPRQSPDDVANAIAAVLERPRPEVFPHRISRGLGILNAIAPGFCDQLVRRWGRKPV